MENIIITTVEGWYVMGGIEGLAVLIESNRVDVAAEAVGC